MSTSPRRTVLLLTIANGAGHTSSARAVAASLEALDASFDARVVDVSRLMSPVARFTHVTAYMWLVTNAPGVWERIDRYQNRQPATSPEWFYRRHCRRVFDLARAVRPVALVATEVGCAEIAALVKRDLGLTAPLVAVNPEYDADRAWVRSEVDLFSAASEQVASRLVGFGADPERVRVWGSPMSDAFASPVAREAARASVCAWLGLDPDRPIVLVAGGAAGLGPLDEAVRRLSALGDPCPQVIALAGRSARLLDRFGRVERARPNVRALGWTDRIAELMRAADLQVSKLGNTFDEALAAELPLVALEPPPGAERVQFRLVEEWGVGRPARTCDDVEREVAALLADPGALEAMRARARARRRTGAAREVARWIAAECGPARAAAVGGTI